MLDLPSSRTMKKWRIWSTAFPSTDDSVLGDVKINWVISEGEYWILDDNESLWMILCWWISSNLRFFQMVVPNLRHPPSEVTPESPQASKKIRSTAWKSIKKQWQIYDKPSKNIQKLRSLILHFHTGRISASRKAAARPVAPSSGCLSMIFPDKTARNDFSKKLFVFPRLRINLKGTTTCRRAKESWKEHHVNHVSTFMYLHPQPLNPFQTPS